MKARLTSEVITKLNHPKNALIKRGMMLPMGITSRSTLWATLGINEWNGNLTKESVLQYLEQELGMTRNNLLEIVDE